MRNLILIFSLILISCSQKQDLKSHLIHEKTVLESVIIGETTSAEVLTKDVLYQEGNAELEGYLALPPHNKKAPAIVIVHQWMGITDHERERAKALAQEGYLVLAADIYGKGVRASNAKEAGQLAGKYRSDRALLRKRVQAAVDFVRSLPQVEKKSVVAMGYCFGGGAVLELARSGSDVKGVVSFHGNLDTPNPNDANNIRAKVLVLHGAADPHVPPEQVLNFQKEMEDAGVDWSLVSYGNAVHAFTQKSAGNDPSKGAAYNENANRRSWDALQDFLNEVFG